MKPFTGQELIKELKKRNNHAVQFIMEKYFPMIEFMVVKMGGYTDDAKDIFQEALIIIITKIDKDELQLTAKFSTYLYAICKNLRLMQQKQEMVALRYMKKDSTGIHKPCFTENYDRKLKQKIFKYYFEQLSEVCQKVLRLYWLEKPVEEIARILDKKENSIRTRKLICKKRLIRLIVDNPDKI